MAKVTCKNCPLVKSNDWGVSCGLGYDLHWEKSEGEYVADNCELESINTSQFKFRPTKRAAILHNKIRSKRGGAA